MGTWVAFTLGLFQSSWTKVCRREKITSSDIPCLLPCLKHSLVHRCVVYDSLLQASRDHPALVSHLTVEKLRLWVFTSPSGFTWVLRIHTAAHVLTKQAHYLFSHLPGPMNLDAKRNVNWKILWKPGPSHKCYKHASISKRIEDLVKTVIGLLKWCSQSCSFDPFLALERVRVTQGDLWGPQWAWQFGNRASIFHTEPLHWCL